MKIKLVVEKRKVKCALPYEGAAHVEAGEACACGSNKVVGRGCEIAADDRHYRADARCVGCDALRGALEVWPETLFGLHEDEAVLNGRAKVY